MSFEDKLLLYLTCSSINEQLLHKIKDILSTGLDWNYVLGRAIHNKVFPTLYQHLRLLATTELRNLIPQSVLARARELNYSFIGYSIVLHEEVRKIFKSLKAGGIEFTPIKGVLLADTVYPKKHLRFFSDIDLLFPSVDEMRGVVEKLAKLGYNFVSSNARESVFRKHIHGISIDCDMHRSLSFFDFFEYPRANILIEDLWRKSSKNRVGGVKAKVMSAEHMLLVLCLHSFHDGALSLIDLCDAIHILRKHPRLDWQFISRQLKEYPCALGIPMSIINGICADFLGVNLVPKTVFKALCDNNLIASRISWKSAKQSLGNLQYPVPYRKFCLECVDYTHCPLSLHLYFHRPRDYIRRCLLDFYCILTIVKERYGIKYASKCFYQECAGVLDFLVGKLIKVLEKEPRIPKLNPFLRHRHV